MAGVVLTNKTHITVPKVIPGLAREYINVTIDDLITPYGLLLPMDSTGFNLFNRLTNRSDLQHEYSRHGISRVTLLRHDGTLHDLRLVPKNEAYVNGSLRVATEHIGIHVTGEEMSLCTLRTAMGMANDDLSKALEYLSLITLIRPENYEVVGIAELTERLKAKRCYKRLKLDGTYVR